MRPKTTTDRRFAQNEVNWALFALAVMLVAGTVALFAPRAALATAGDGAVVEDTLIDEEITDGELASADDAAADDGAVLPDEGTTEDGALPAEEEASEGDEAVDGEPEQSEEAAQEEGSAEPGDAPQAELTPQADEFTRTWRDLANALDSASSTSGQVVIKIGSQFDRYLGDPDLVLNGGNVVLDLDGFALDPRVGGKPAGNGRVITIKGGTLTLRGKTSWTNGGITGGSADLGGGILVEGGTLRMEGGLIKGNSAERGGGITVTGGSLVIAGGQIESNKATYGGGVYVAPEGSISITGGTVTTNTADYGGGLLIEGNNDVETDLTGGDISKNHATADGGGMLVSGRVVRLSTGVVLQGNVADSNGGNLAVGSSWSASESIVGANGGILRDGTSATGGGAAVIEGKFMSMYGSSITNNRASTGGGIALLAGECRVLDGTISNNSASHKGGGIAVMGGRLSVWGGSVEGNRAEPVDDEWGETTTAEGGGILVGADGQVELGHQFVIRGNVRGDNAQDVFLEGDSVIEVADSFYPKAPVGVDVAELPELGQTRLVATGRFAADAFTCQAPDCEMEYEQPGNALLKRVTEHEGTRVTSWADLSQRLRALSSGEEASFWLSGDIVYGEGMPEAYATRTLEVRRKAVVTIDLNGYSINRGLSQRLVPTEEDSERCIYVSNGSLTIRDGRGGGRITGGCCQRGGGIFVAEGSLVLESGSITSNRATYGGGVYIGMGTFELAGGRIYGNHSLAQGEPGGGGVYVGDNNPLTSAGDVDVSTQGEGELDAVMQASMTFKDGSVDHNMAAGWGAGIVVSNGSLDMVGGTVANNDKEGSASVGGGGIHVCGDSDARIKGGSIKSNYLYGSDGGGIAIKEGSKLALSGGTISQNTARVAGGGVSIEGSEFDFVGGTIDNNFTYGSGAGILLKNGAVCRMSAGTISNNRCRVDGGGMQIDFGGSCVVSGGEIVDNLAFPSANLQGQDEEPVGEELQGEHFSSGGAINARGDLTVSGGTIARNGALIGCGICYNCENWQTQKHSVTLSGSPLFQDNCLSHDPANKTDLSIFMDKDEDETARVSIDGTFTPPRSVGIEKLYRPDWNLVALADGGDYEMSAFRNMQGDRFELVRMGDTLYARSPRSDYSGNEGGQKENAANQTPVTSHANGRGQASTSGRQLPKTGDLSVVGVGICAGVGTLAIMAGVFCGRTDRRDGEGASDQPAA